MNMKSYPEKGIITAQHVFDTKLLCGKERLSLRLKYSQTAVNE